MTRAYHILIMTASGEACEPSGSGMRPADFREQPRSSFAELPLSRPRSPTWTRTRNLSVNSRLLCQLSYREIRTTHTLPGPLTQDCGSYRELPLFNVGLQSRGRPAQRRFVPPVSLPDPASGRV